MPHGVTQRGNRWRQMFLQERDYAACRELVAEWWLNSDPREEFRGGEYSHTVRPLGSPAFFERLEGMVGRVLRPQKGGWARTLPSSPK